MTSKVVPWLRRIVAALLPWSPTCDCRPVDVEFVLFKALSVPFH